MRKKIFAALVLILLGVFSVSQVYAKDGVKIAYVDLQRALLEVEEGKAAKSKLKVYFDEKQALLDKESDRLKKMKGDLDRQEMTIDPQIKTQKEAELQKKFLELQKIYYNLQNELKQKESDAVAPILEKMQGLLQGIAEKEGYDIILDKNSSGIVYAPMKYDITNQLIRVYDEKNKGKK